MSSPLRRAGAALTLGPPPRTFHKRGDFAAPKLLFKRLDGADIEPRIEQLEHSRARRATGCN